MSFHIIGLVVLDVNGSRIVGKYFTENNKNLLNFPSNFDEQRHFEKDLVAKSSRLPSRSEVEILMLEETIVLYKCINDINIYIIGCLNENEIILYDVMNAFTNSLSSITNGNINKSNIQENLGALFILLDELLEEDRIFEIDPNVIVNRISMATQEECDLHDQKAFNHALNNAKDSLLRSFLLSHT